MTKGRFITLEGIDGAGKSTQLAWMEERLREAGRQVVVTREPGGTAFGEALRSLLLTGQHGLHSETELLLMFAARREHIDKVIGPALDRGDWVLCDRFSDASYAYQAAGSGVDWDKVGVLEAWVQGGLQPDLTLFFDLPPAVGRARAGASRKADRFEREQAAFYERVRAGYLRRAMESGGRMRIVDADRTVSEIQVELDVIIASIC
jgi:dTMP kinase